MWLIINESLLASVGKNGKFYVENGCWEGKFKDVNTILYDDFNGREGSVESVHKVKETYDLSDYDLTFCDFQEDDEKELFDLASWLELE